MLCRRKLLIVTREATFLMGTCCDARERAFRVAAFDSHRACFDVSTRAEGLWQASRIGMLRGSTLQDCEASCLTIDLPSDQRL